MVYISKIIDEFGERIINGGQIDRYEALKLINIEQSAEVYHLFVQQDKRILSRQ